MKYVVLVHPQTGDLKFRLGLLERHDRLAAPLLALGYTVRGAGFLRFLDGGVFETFGESDSLNARPHADDAEEIRAFYNATLRTATGSNYQYEYNR